MSYEFLDNKYTKWYNQLCSRGLNRRLECYSEKHHIIPKCLGGNDCEQNLVRLTAREHFIAHILLTKMTSGLDKSRMHLAVRAMCNWSKFNNRDIKISSRKFDMIKQNAKQYFIGLPSVRKGTKISEETRKKIKAARAKQVITRETYEKASKTMSSLVWMNDGTRSYRIKKELVNEKLIEGLHLGRLLTYVTNEYKQKLSDITKQHWNKKHL